jgi:hypothetical protein
VSTGAKLLHRLSDAGATAVVTHAGGVAKLATLRDALPGLDGAELVDRQVRHHHGGGLRQQHRHPVARPDAVGPQAVYNIAVDVCDRWAAADPTRPAILDVDPAGRVETWKTFRPEHHGERQRDGAELVDRQVRHHHGGGLRQQHRHAEASNRLANGLRAHGVRAGDRVAVLLPQSPAVVRVGSAAAQRSQTSTAML